MKCLLCNYNGELIKEDYIQYHKINKNNYFFKQLFQKNNFCIEKVCIRCNKFISTNKFMIQHNFLEHYESGQRKPAEFKSIDVIKNKDILIHKIDFSKHSEEYDFYNSHEIVDDFLLNVSALFKPKNKVFLRLIFLLKTFKTKVSFHQIQQTLQVYAIGVVMFIVEFTLMTLLLLKFATIF